MTAGNRRRAAVLLGHQQTRRKQWPTRSDILGAMSPQAEGGEVYRKCLRGVPAFLAITGLIALLLKVYWFGSLVLLLGAISYGWGRGSSYARVTRFDEDYPPFLLALASSIRAGLDPLSALQSVGRLFPPESEVAKCVSEFNDHLETGASESDAITRFAANIEHPDIGLLRSAFLLSRQEGASLVGCLERLAQVTRRRQAFRRKVQSSLALQRLSSIGIGACAGAIAFIQAVANPDIVVKAFDHPMGFKILVLGGCLMVIGAVWMVHVGRWEER